MTEKQKEKEIMLEAARRIIIEPNTIQFSFLSTDNGVLAESSINGRAVDGRVALFLTDGDESSASNALGKLKDDNPNIDFELCRSISPMGPRSTADRIRFATGLVGKVAMKLARQEAIQEGRHTLSLDDILPSANVGWQGIWALTKEPLEAIRTNYYQEGQNV